MTVDTDLDLHRNLNLDLPVADLGGRRIGLSGAIPDPDEWGGRALDWEILNAVSTLADTVFSGGGHLVHGSHPSFTPRILAQAEPYAEERGAPVATFLLSALFAEDPLVRLLREHEARGVCELVMVPAVYPPGHEGRGAGDAEVRNASLTAMRERLVEGLDLLFVIGGKRWSGSKYRPGTLEEAELAQARGIEVVPLGGLGGMAAELAAGLATGPDAEPIPIRGSSRTPVLDLTFPASWEGGEPEVSLDLLRAPGRTRGGLRTFARTRGFDALPDDAGQGAAGGGARHADDTFIRTTTDYGRAIGLVAERLARHGRG